MGGDQQPQIEIIKASKQSLYVTRSGLRYHQQQWHKGASFIHLQILPSCNRPLSPSLEGVHQLKVVSDTNGSMFQCQSSGGNKESACRPTSF